MISHPSSSIAVSLSSFAIIRFGNTINLYGQEVKLMIADVNVGILYLLSILRLGVYGVTLADGFNNKYSLLGGLRSSAQMISYELSMGSVHHRCADGVGNSQADQIVLIRRNYLWGVAGVELLCNRWLLSPLFVAAFAETNRLAVRPP